MSMFTRGSPQDITLSALRVVAGLLFMQHGVQKLFGMLGSEGVGNLMSLMGLAGALEFFGGLIILVGLYTRPVAFILSGEMAFAYFMGHFSATQFPEGWVPIQNRGELAALYCFVFLFLAAAGGGTYGFDGLMRGAGGSSPGTRGAAPGDADREAGTRGSRPGPAGTPPGSAG